MSTLYQQTRADCQWKMFERGAATFERYLKHTIEHGHANDRGDNFFSVGYWYQDKPYTDFPPMPAAPARLPVVKTA